MKNKASILGLVILIVFGVSFFVYAQENQEAIVNNSVEAADDMIDSGSITDSWSFFIKNEGQLSEQKTQYYSTIVNII